MRTVTQIVAAFLFAVVMGGLWRVVPIHVMAPDIALLVALYLGASARGHAWEATAAALAIGYLHDVVDGGPRGLAALVLGAICLCARLATARLLVRGTVFTIVFAWLGAVAAAALTCLAQVMFAGDALPVPIGRELPVALGSSLLTALLAPWIFRVCRWIDARYARTERERQALREGYLT